MQQNLLKGNIVEYKQDGTVKSPKIWNYFFVIIGVPSEANMNFMIYEIFSNGAAPKKTFVILKWKKFQTFFIALFWF